MSEITFNIDRLTEEQKAILEITGIEIYKKLVENYGGSCIYISKYDTITQSERNEEIRKYFNGGNYRELAKKYNLSENRIRVILRNKNVIK